MGPGQIQIPGDRHTGMGRPDTLKIGGLKKKEKKKIPGYRDTGMARPDTCKIGGLKKKKKKKKGSIQTKKTTED